VVDDEPLVCNLIVDTLRNAGFAAEGARKLHEVQARLAAADFDLVITDLKLPDGSGVDLLAACQDRASRIPFVLISGFADTDEVIRALNLGARALLEKPFDIQRLLEVVEQALAPQRCERVEAAFRRHQAAMNRELRQCVADAVAENQRLFLGSLAALAKAIDARDPYTQQHSASVARLARDTAAQLALPEDDIQVAEMAGSLHDIGKLAVPEGVLLKPGRLTDAEFAQIKLHPAKSREILLPLPGMEACAAAVYAHHERVDGTGYPQGLAGERIPLLGRILSVCDAWDAMTTHRPYRRALSADRALAILHGDAGTQFDPAVVQAFFRLSSIAPLAAASSVLPCPRGPSS